MNIIEQAQHAELALAAYANLQSEVPSESDLTNIGFTSHQAIQFINRYTVVAQFGDGDTYEVRDPVTGQVVEVKTNNTGLSATVFKDKDGAHYLAIRGSDTLYDWHTNILDVTILGTAEHQEQYKALKAKYAEWQTMGVLPDPSQQQVTVTGHSLGGYLAAALTAEFSSEISHTYLYNAPGFEDGSLLGYHPLVYLARKLTENTAIENIDVSKVSNIKADAGISPIANLGTQVAPTTWIPIEDQERGVSDSELSGNHSQRALVDALSFLAALSQLDPNATVKDLTRTFKEASNQNELTLEAALDTLRNLLGIGGIDVTPTLETDRDSFYRNLQTLLDHPTYQALQGSVKIQSAGHWLDAKSNFGAFLSLYYLAPFLVVPLDAAASQVLEGVHLSIAEQWNADQALSPDQIEAGLANFSDLYLADRATMLGWIVERNSKDIEDGILRTNTVYGHDYKQIDGNSDGSDISLSIASTVSGVSNPRIQIVFGSDSDDTSIVGGDVAVGDRLYGGGGNDIIRGNGGDDYIEGNAGVDRLFGGTGGDTLLGGEGNDTLSGDKGNDVLKGGNGADTYVFRNGDGIDTIIDPDNDGGQIRWEVDADGNGGIPVNGGKETYVGSGVWLSDDKQFKYLLIKESDQSTTLLIIRDTDRVYVKNFEEGKLGIQLQDASATSPVPSNLTITGDLKPIDMNPNEEDIQYGYDNLGNVLVQSGIADPDREDTLYDSAGNDLIQAGGGDDVVHAFRGGHDRIEGGEGRDILKAGSGDDILIGGTGTDILVGGEGDDYLYGESEEPLQVAIENGESQQATGQKGDWISGGEGDDVAIGTAANDVLMGGSGKDVLVGGGGDDYIYGDLNWVAHDFSWSVTREVNGEEGDFGIIVMSPLTFDSGIGEVPDDDILYGGAGNDFMGGGGGNDTIFGGTGDDWITGDGPDVAAQYEGNDYIDGGDGADHIAGDGGHDILFGGEGNDRIWGDSDAISEARHGDDYIDGGGGDDYLRGQGGNDTIFGSDGKDTLLGEKGNDYLNGGADDDLLHGGEGNDVLLGEDGNDELQGGEGDDILDGGSGDDLMFGDDGDDVLVGGEGNDQLQGGDGNDLLMGGSGNDVLFGDEGNDTLDGGEGDDYLLGGSGNDTYLNVDAGDVIIDTEGHNVIHFSNHIRLDSIDIISVYKNGSPTWVMSIGGQDFFEIERNATGATQAFQFIDGTSLNLDEILGRRYFGQHRDYYGDDDDVVHGYAGDDVIDGWEGNDTIYGNDGNDTLYGGEGDDLITGGRGSDYLVGGEGGDSYFFSRGDGQDIIDDGGSASAQDKLVFGEGIVRNDIEAFRLASGDLELRIKGTSDQVTIKNWYNDAENRVEIIEFGDGTLVTAQEFDSLTVAPIEGTEQGDVLIGTEYDDRIMGHSGNDLILGGKGNDTLEGGEGIDTYVFSYGGGVDSILDASSEGNLIRLAPNMSLSQLDAHRRGDDLFLNIAGVQDGFLIKDYFSEVQDWNVMENSGSTMNVQDIFEATYARNDNINETLLRNFVNYHLYEAHSQFSGYQVLEDGTYYTRSGYVSADIYEESRKSTTKVTYGDGSTTTSTSTSTSREWITHGFIEEVKATVGYYFAQGSDFDVLPWTPERIIRPAIVEVNWSPIEWHTRNENTSIQGNNGGGASAGGTSGTSGNDVGQLITSTTDSYKEGAATGVIKDWAFGYVNSDSEEYYPEYVQLDHYYYQPLWGVWHLEATSDDDMIGVGGENLVVSGGDGDDIIWGAGFVDGGSGNDEISGYSYDLLIGEDRRTLIGGEGDDKLWDGAILIGGEGSDYMDGGMGSTRYIIDPYEFGNDLIWDSGPARLQRTNEGGEEIDDIFPSMDVIEFLSGVTPEDVKVEWSVVDDRYSDYEASDYIKLSWGEGKSVVFNLVPANEEEGVGVELIRFHDGSTWTADEIRARAINPVPTAYSDGIPGTHGEDMIDGLEGDDIIKGLSGNDVLFGSGGNDALYGGVGDDALYGGTGNDFLLGEEGNDLLLGGSGDDHLQDEEGSNLFVGGDGADYMESYSDTGLFIGGRGNDEIYAGHYPGTHVVLFNRGDGKDTIYLDGEGNTISLGQDISYADLLFSKNGNDLVLSVGQEEQLTFENWYSSIYNRNVANLQMVIEGGADYDATSESTLHNKKITQFDFAGLVSQFDQARSMNGSLTSWSLSTALLNFHLNSSDTEAIGGDLTYQYATNGNLANVGISTAQSIIGSTSFGIANQAIQSPIALQDNSTRLA